jgi:hypothetical protein
VKARLVDRRVLRVPATDTGLVTVDDDNLEMRVLEGNDSGSRATYEDWMSANGICQNEGIPSIAERGSRGVMLKMRGKRTDVTSTDAANLANIVLSHSAIGSDTVEPKALD